MAKKFRIPPPILPPSPENAQQISLDVDPVNFPQTADAYMKTAGLDEIRIEVRKQFLPYVRKKFAKDSTEPASELAQLLEQILEAMVLCYYAKRVGNIDFKLEVRDPITGKSTLQVEGIEFLRLGASFLEKRLGENQAAQVFRKMETITNKVLEKKFGPQNQR